MSYALESSKISRQPFFIVKLELDNAISPTGTEYHCNGRAPLGQRFYSSIVDGGVDIAPTKMGVGSGLGFLGGVTIQFEDFPYGENGTYWGKLLANNLYYLDRIIRVYEGFYDGVTFDFNNFKEKLYFIKKVRGPDSNGRVILTAQDPLTLLKGDQALIPTTPDAKLLANITETQTGTINITDNSGFSASGGTAEFNGEYVKYSGLSGSDSIIVTARGAFGSKTDQHDAGDQVSNTHSYENKNVVDVIRELIEEYSEIDTSTYINDSDWNAVRDNFLVGGNAIGVYPSGTKIKDAIESLCEQFRISVFWNDEDQEIKLVSIGPLVVGNKRITITKHIFDEKEDVVRDPTKVVTTTIVYYGRKNHAEAANDKNNYDEWLIDPNEEAEAGLGKSIIREIYAENIPLSGTSSANSLAAKINRQFVEGLITYHFRLDVSESDIKVGDVFEVFTTALIGKDGLPLPTSFIAIERVFIEGTVYQYKAIKTGFALGSKYRLIAPNNLSSLTYATATEEQKAKYLFIAQSDGEFSNNDPGHQIY